MSQELHQAIMNLPCPETRLTDANSVQAIYARGHRDARHAAAELALALVPADSDEPDLAHVKDMRHLAIYGAASLARFSNWDGVSPELSRAMCSAAIAIRDKAKALTADSDEPITAEWLREMGFEDHYEHSLGLHTPQTGWLVGVHRNMSAIYVHERRVCHDQTTFTRGQLRQLLSALGIQPTSKETR
jgi:hypothetical protein